MIAILDYGMGNLRSVLRAVTHVGGDAEITGDAGTVAAADALIVPGVGHFGACMRNLRGRSLAEPVSAFAATRRPVLGVCLGMQVLFDSSEEQGPCRGAAYKRAIPKRSLLLLIARLLFLIR